MQVTRPVALVLFVLAGGCAANSGDRRDRELASKPIRGGVAEFAVTSFDGKVLRGRVLIGATVDPLVIRGQLKEWINVEFEDIRQCGKSKKDWLKAMMFEALILGKLWDEIITIRPGYWYGGSMYYPLFDKELTGNEPACFEADLVVRDVDMRVAARLPIRVVRTDQPSPSTDGAPASPKPPASDAGAPATDGGSASPKPPSSDGGAP